MQYWASTLGIDISDNKNITTSGLSFSCFNTLSQWGIDFILKETKQKMFSIFYNSCKIKDICKIGSGGTPSRGNQEYYDGDIPWIKTGELLNEIIYDTEEKITKEAVSNSSAKLYPEGSIILAMYGATIGKTAKLGIKATTNQACAVLYDIDDALVNSDYLWFYLQTQTNKFKEMAYGGAQPNINAGIVSNYYLPLPPLDVQMELVNHTVLEKNDIRSLKEEVRELRKKSDVIVENLLFGTLCSK